MERTYFWVVVVVASLAPPPTRMARDGACRRGRVAACLLPLLLTLQGVAAELPRPRAGVVALPRSTRAPIGGMSGRAPRHAASDDAADEDDGESAMPLVSAEPPAIKLTGGAAAINAGVRDPTVPLLLGGFLFCLSSAMVALCPAPHLISVMGSEPAMRLLASITSGAAVW